MNEQGITFLFHRDKERFTVSLAAVALIYLLIPGCAVLSSPSEQVAASGTNATYRDREYLIGPEDVLDISVWREETLQRQVLVRPDGGISFPLVGNLQAAEKTPQELEAEITEKLRRYIPEPTVTVSLDKVASYRVYILGQVGKPGQYNVGRYVDVLQALTLAGGLTPFASEGNIKILRRENGEEIVLPFSYSSVKKGKELSQNIILKRDDVVVVP